MKNSQIAFWVAVAGALSFVFNIHQIHSLEQEAASWLAQVDANNHPGIGSYIESFFDGLTLGATSGGDVFAVAHRMEQTDRQLEQIRVSLLNRYEDAVFYRNLGLIVCIGAFFAWRKLDKTESLKGHFSPNTRLIKAQDGGD